MIVYRPPTSADHAATDAMARQVWIETFGHSAAPADIDAYLEKSYGEHGALRRQLADEAFIFQLAVEGDAVVGYCKLGPTFFRGEVPTEGATHLHQLYVAATHHGAGIAPALLEWAKDQARAVGHEALLLTVWEENARARRFYEKHGFAHVGDYAFQTGSQIDRDLIMRLAL